MYSNGPKVSNLHISKMPTFSNFKMFKISNKFKVYKFQSLKVFEIINFEISKIMLFPSLEIFKVPNSFSKLRVWGNVSWIFRNFLK